MIYSLIFSVCIILFSLLSFFFGQKKKQEPLKNSEKVKVEYLSPYGSKSLDLYFPSKVFIENMQESYKKGFKSLFLLWEKEKIQLQDVWNSIDHKFKNNFVKKMNDELEYNLSAFCSKESFVELICPEFVLSIKSESSINNFVELLDKMVSIKNNKKLIKTDFLIIDAEKYIDELDPSKEKKINSALINEIENFLGILRNMAILMYINQFISRYRFEIQPKKKSYLKKLYSLLVFAFVSFFLTLVFDHVGIISYLFPDYVSPFGNIINSLFQSILK